MEKMLHNERGAHVVWRELLLALIESRPDRELLVEHSISASLKMRDMLLNSNQPDAVLAGLDAEVQFWQRRVQGWHTAALPPPPEA